MKKSTLTLFVAAMALGGSQAHSAAGVDRIHWSGFLNAIAAVSDSETPYLEAIDEDGDFSTSNFGLNATVKINNQLTLAGQIVGGDEGETMDFDWGFASYHFNETVTGKVGKIKYPGNIVSEYVDVGFAYPWVRPPESIYSEQSELFFEAYKGASVLFEGGGDAIEYAFELYGGQVSEENEIQDKMIAAVVSLSNDYGKFLAGYNRSTVDDEGGEEDGEDKTLWTFGAQADWKNVVFYAEFAHSEISNFSDEDTDGWFTTLGYRFGNTLPHVTYQSFELEEGAEQTSWTLGVKQQLGTNTVLKLEWQLISDIQDGGLFEEELDDDDVNLFNAALNFVF